VLSYDSFDVMMTGPFCSGRVPGGVWRASRQRLGGCTSGPRCPPPRDRGVGG